MGEIEGSLASDRVFVEVAHNISDEQQSRLMDWVYIQFDDPLANTEYILQSATRLDVNYTLIEQFNSWQTSWTEYLANGEIDEMDYIHLFDFGVAPVYRLEYALQQPVKELRITGQTEHSLTISWSRAAGGISSYVVIKPTGYDDAYYVVAKAFTQVETETIRNLISGTSYTIKVYHWQVPVQLASVVNTYEDNSWAFVVITCLFA